MDARTIDPDGWMAVGEALLPGAIECVRAGHIPGGLHNNRAFAECMVGYDSGIAEEIRALLFDPQTAGGLLMSVQSNGIAWAAKLNDAGIPAVEIGVDGEAHAGLLCGGGGFRKSPRRRRRKGFTRQASRRARPEPRAART